MALFTGKSGYDYARGHMPTPKLSDGPWGEAIRYWMAKRQWLQADLARESGIEPKTVSSIVRGFDTTTKMLRRIADALDIPLDAVFVSPDRKLANEERRKIALEVAEHVLRTMEARGVKGLPPHETTAEESLEQAVRALEKTEAVGQTVTSKPSHRVTTSEGKRTRKLGSPKSVRRK